MTAESEKTLKKAEAKIYSALCESGYSHEEAWAVMYDYRGVSALQIAEKAVGEITTGRTDMAYVVCDIYEQCGEEILSRIKSELNSSSVNEDINTTEIGGE